MYDIYKLNGFKNKDYLKQFSTNSSHTSHERKKKTCYLGTYEHAVQVKCGYHQAKQATSGKNATKS